MAFQRFGIGARLFIAFVVITAVSLSSGIASWIVLRKVSDAQSRLIAEAMPAVSAAQRTAEMAARLIAAAPAMTASTDEATRQRQEALLSSLANEIRQSVADAGITANSSTAASLRGAVDELIFNLSAQNALVKERIALNTVFAQRTMQTIEAATKIVDLSETLVSNASAGATAVIASLYGLIEEPRHREQAYEALDRLTEHDIYVLGNMFELRLRSSQIGLLTNQLTRAITEAEVAKIAGDYRDHLRVIRRRVASIDDPVRREQAAAFLAVLDATDGEGPWGRSLFGQRLRLIEIAAELERVSVANAATSGSVGRIAQAMLADSERFARQTAEQAGVAVGTGFYSLVVSSVVAIMISGLIVWLYVERRVVRRLGSLAVAMQRLTNGDLTADVADEGTHELKALSRAVRAFRDESKRRRALEMERERTNEELRRHREELQVLVDERTMQLQEANAKLQQEVVKHAEAREKAEIANRAKSDFLATISHEIRTPMTGMLGMLRILSAAQLNKEQRRHLDVATNSGEALLGILNSILDYSKIESGNIAIEPVRFNVKDTLAGVVDLMRPSAVEKSLKLGFSSDGSAFGDHIGDVGKLRQIVFNLVSNAIKFTERGRVSVTVRRTGSDGNGDRLSISVADTGIGIAPRDMERIFEPFTQTDASITRRFGGTGLGLAISRRLAEVMGGTLTVKSRPHAGSCFTLDVVLPRAQGATEAIASPLRELPRRHSSLRILAVEDDPATQIVVQTFLESMGHQVTMAADGYCAVDAARQTQPDLVIIDVSLPGMDGLEAARRIRAIAGLASVPILAMSAHVFKDEIATYLQAGMNGFVGKPLTPEALAEAVDTVFGMPATEAYAEQMPVLDRGVLDADLAALGRSAVERILDAAEHTLPGQLAALRRFLADDDLASAAKVAHAICSAAASAGFSALYNSAGNLERAARAGEAAAARRHLAACETYYPSAMAAARRLLLQQA